MADRPNRRQRRGQERRGTTRRKTEFSYRGYTIEELKELSLEEVMELLPARPRRTLQRGLDEEGRKFVDKVESTPEDEVLRTHCRDVPILPSMVGRTIQVHNGVEFERVDIQPDMIGHYLGEFALTRKKVEHTGPGVGATRSSKFMPLK